MLRTGYVQMTTETLASLTVQYSTVIVGGDPKPRHQPVLLAVCDPVSHNGDYAAPAAELLVLGCSSTDPFVMVLGCFQ